MDSKKIGTFLKIMRKEKELTQEQLAEILSVSGRTVSRWETGINMPDLSILIQIADYYNIEIRDILDGERKSKNVNSELKETLSKVADYASSEKECAKKIGSISFSVIFIICAAMIILQLFIVPKVYLVFGETVALLMGGITYIILMIKNGSWEGFTSFKSTPKTDALMSVICSGFFSIAYALILHKVGTDEIHIARFSLLFYASITCVCFIVLRLIAFFNQKSKKRIISAPETVANSMTKLCNVENIIIAQTLISVLKENGISAYSQESSSQVVTYNTSGFGLYGVDIYTNTTNARKASEIVGKYNNDNLK